MKHAAGYSGLLRRSAPADRVQAVQARGASDRAQMQERFLRELGAAELRLRDEGIPHVLIGSLACWAHAGHGVAPVFGRPEAFSAVQRCPDIDVLVPRAARGPDAGGAAPGGVQRRQVLADAGREENAGAAERVRRPGWSSTTSDFTTTG